MKFLKVVLALLGVAGIIGAGAWLAVFAFDMQEIVGAAQRYDSARHITNPSITTLGIAGVALGGGLLLGLGLGLPNRTSRQIRNAALDDATALREAEIRTRAAGTGEITEG